MPASNSAARLILKPYTIKVELVCRIIAKKYGDLARIWLNRFLILHFEPIDFNVNLCKYIFYICLMNRRSFLGILLIGCLTLLSWFNFPATA
ncbi:MAG: hypothetical protein ACRC2V_04790, partial [Xenococcaceae cyanobacterium]